MNMNACQRDSEFEFNLEISGCSCPSIAPKKPKLVAHKEVEDRIARLNEVWGSANVIVKNLSAHYQNRWDGAIVEMSDIKGTLEITWRDLISRKMFEGVILGAWEGNAEHMSLHRLMK